MDTVKLEKLIRHRRRLSEELKAEEEAFKEQQRERKTLLKRIDARLCESINKEEGGLQSMKLSDGSATAYALYTDTMKVADRSELEDGIVADLPESYANLVRDRLGIFGNTVVKDYCQGWRKDTGAEEKNNRLVGGELPPGIGMYVKKEVRVTKGT